MNISAIRQVKTDGIGILLVTDQLTVTDLMLFVVSHFLPRTRVISLYFSQMDLRLLIRVLVFFEVLIVACC